MEPSFWSRPSGDVAVDIARLHAEAPLDWFEEPDPGDTPIERGPGYWAVCRHDDVRTVSRDPAVYSSAAGVTVTNAPPEFVEFFSSMIGMDDPRHARLRRIVAKGFTPKMLTDLDGTVQQVATSVVDGICERGSCDFVTEVAAALPLKIVCDLMGIPEQHYATVFANSNIILGITDDEFRPPDVDFYTALLNAGAELAAVMNEVAEDKRDGDGTDLTSVLVNADLPDDQLSQSDLASFFILLVIAGNETTRNAISWGLSYLTDNPDQRAIWADDFERVAPTAVEEIVRLSSPVTYMRRTTTTDTVLAGQPLAAGDKVAMFYAAANRDPAVFDDPDRFDVLRDPNPQYGYGGPGPHYCLGAHLARREITVVYRELFARLPDIVAAGEPDVLHASFIHGVKHLPAEFTPTRAAA
ncbi:MAG TPA: cytochrome P450 [Acidimicrobiaceae bacterium]|nr:cytochrome P450 [Acidimicrobiaceae bacterium]HCB37561.1 cytochrome P450 [Acidimicrobiaceae bacterium]